MYSTSLVTSLFWNPITGCRKLPVAHAESSKIKPQETLNCLPFLRVTPRTRPRGRKRASPAVAVTSQTALPVGIFEGVVRVLEGLVPEEAGFAAVQAGLVLESPVVLPVSGVAL